MYYTIYAAKNKGADQTAWMHRLISTFVRICHKRGFVMSGLIWCNYTPNFEEVDGILVSGCVCVCPFIKTVHARVLKFHIWIPHGKIVDTRFCFLYELSPFLELCPFEKIQMKSDACHILWTVHIWIPHGKNSWARGLKLCQLLGDNE